MSTPDEAIKLRMAALLLKEHRTAEEQAQLEAYYHVDAITCDHLSAGLLAFTTAMNHNGVPSNFSVLVASECVTTVLKLIYVTQSGQLGIIQPPSA
jgi:hypothetical protein